MRVFQICMVSLMFLYADCTNTKSREQKRKELIEQAVAAFETYDTTRLYRIVDTSYHFGIYGKDGFIFNVDFIFKRFKFCNSKVSDSAMKIAPYPVHATEYTIPYCRTDSGTIDRNSFDLVFLFADYEPDNRIMLFNVKRYLPQNDSVIFAPPKKPH